MLQIILIPEMARISNINSSWYVLLQESDLSMECYPTYR